MKINEGSNVSRLHPLPPGTNGFIREEGGEEYFSVIMGKFIIQDTDLYVRCWVL
jgi:hypothetical protein